MQPTLLFRVQGSSVLGVYRGMVNKNAIYTLFRGQSSGLLLNNIPHRRNDMLGEVFIFRGGGVLTSVLQ